MSGFIYIDGAEFKLSHTEFQHSFGYSGIYQGTLIEGRGNYTVEKRLGGSHELYAFISTLNNLSGLSLDDLLKVRLFVDTDLVSHGLASLLPGTPWHAHKEAALKQLTNLGGLSEDQWAIVHYGNIYKIKGHIGHAHQERADYLAASWKSEQPLGFDDWLKVGKKEWDKETMQMVTVPYPFVESI